MRTLNRLAIAFLTCLAFMASACRPPMLAPMPPQSPAFSAAASNPVIGYGELRMAVKWPARIQRSTQAIPAAANSIYLTIRKRNGALLKDYLFVRPSVTSALIATASLAVHVSTESLVVQASAYRETIATTSAVPAADHIIAQGTKENVAVTLNETTNVPLQLDPEMTIAGIGGASALGTPPSTDDILINGTPDSRGPAYWAELMNPAHLAYDRLGRYLYFTEDPDPVRSAEGIRLMRCSLNPSGSNLSYGLLTVIAGGSVPDTTRNPDSTSASETTLGECQGIAADGNGKIYLSDSTSHTIRMIDTTAGTIRTIAGNDVAGYFDSSNGVGASFNQPRGLLLSGGTLYVADSGNDAIRTINVNQPGFPVSTLAEGSGTATSSWVARNAISLPGPQALAKSGNFLYVAAGGFGSGQVIALDLTTQKATTIAGLGNYSPSAGAPVYDSAFGALSSIVASGSTLYVADSNRIYQMTATQSATASVFAGTGSPKSEGDGGSPALASINGATGLLTYGNALLLCDSGGNRIRKIEGGLISHFAGSSSGTAGLYDGLSTGMMKTPVVLAAGTTAGTFLAFDSGTKRLRSISANGTLTTIAGLGTGTRLARGLDRLNEPRKAHFRKIVDIAFASTSTQVTSLYLAQEDALYGEGVFELSGLDQVPALANNGMGGESLPGVTVRSLIDNITGDEGKEERVLNGLKSIAYSPSLDRLTFSTTGLYHHILRWLGNREVSFAGGGQGITKEAGTGPQGFNQEGNPKLIQVNSPRFMHYDAQGNLYFVAINADGKDVIRKITNGPTPQISTIAGGGTLTPPALTDPLPPISGSLANLGTIADMDIDSKGSLYVASGSRIYRYDPAAMTVSMLYDTSGAAVPRTFKSIAFDENDMALYFTYESEPKIKKVYFSRF